MKDHIISYDFGTGGIKASLYDAEGSALASSFKSYETYYPHVGWHEQRPADWWNAICESTKLLIRESGIDPANIEALAISGHSLGVVPLDEAGELLRDSVPIWSDSRAQEQAAAFFAEFDYEKWYMLTGNGFPAHLYSAFKVLWYKQREPETYAKARMILGTKDYINYLMTGSMLTDDSYASGCGFYDLKNNRYDTELLRKMDLPQSIFPKIVPSTQVIDTLTEKASAALGLPQSVNVVCGGVDNSCMALGARGIYEGRVYTSLGSSSWIAVTSSEPILNVELSPYVFAHVIPGMYTSATSIFAAGSSFRWLRDQLCGGIAQQGEDSYDAMNRLAAASPIGAHKLLFNPSLAGGAGADRTPNIRGAFIGLDLKHTISDVIRATMEGIALSLRVSLDNLKKMCRLQNEMLFVGGGANSNLWLQIFADTYKMDVLKTNVGQSAGSLGAAALAAVGSGMWRDFSPIDEIHRLISKSEPAEEAAAKYDRLLPFYRKVTEHLWEIGDMMHTLDLE